MSTIKIPQNGLPQEITNIPFGQVFIVTNPEKGITHKTIKTVEFIHSVARKIGQKSHIVNSIPVDSASLWDCIICKVKAEGRVQVIVSNWDSLLEMLCVFWGLDYEEVSKIPDIIPGWHKTHKGVTIGGEEHPVRVHIKPVVGTKAEKDDYGVTLELVQAHSRQGTLGDIRSTFKDNFNYGLGISLDDIIALYKEEELNRKTYKLDIQVKWKQVREYKHPKWVIHKKMTDCDISIVDNQGNAYPIKMDTMTKAIYLTFLLFEDGIEYTQISDSNEFYELFKQIYKKLPRAKGTPRKFNLDDKADLDTFTNYTSKTRQAVLNVTNDTYAEEQFAIEGRRKDTYGIAGATAENRAFVRKEFKIK